jgi:hypothetical protein
MQYSSKFIVVGLVLGGIAGVAAPGCGSGIAGTYRAFCEAECQQSAECDKFLPIDPVDLDACKLDCQQIALEFEDELMDSCVAGNDVAVVDGRQAAECREALDRLRQYCQDNDQITGEYNDFTREVGLDCYSMDKPIYYCQ